ncbi:MAG: hypothetical protein DRI86_00860 [Bacteroidetes bacterium]|nr:MAG: hypothetical protein DRI86_00860 [Bacteroidota bacterium]
MSNNSISKKEQLSKNRVKKERTFGVVKKTPSSASSIASLKKGFQKITTKDTLVSKNINPITKEQQLSSSPKRQRSSTSKKKEKNSEKDLHDRSIIVRFSEKEYLKRQTFIMSIGICQICRNNYNMTTPHHSRYGTANKDDRTLVAVGSCNCHNAIHNQSYKGIKLTKKEIEEIGWGNNELYLNSL